MISRAWAARRGSMPAPFRTDSAFRIEQARQRIPDRAERVPQLVRQRRQELVLAGPRALLIDQIGGLAGEDVEVAEVALRRLVGVVPVRGDYPDERAAARKQRRRL